MTEPTRTEKLEYIVRVLTLRVKGCLCDDCLDQEYQAARNQQRRKELEEK